MMERVTPRAYRAYDLAIVSEFPLPGLVALAAPAAADVLIAAVGADLELPAGAAAAASADAQRVRLVWPGIGQALIENGRSIRAHGEPGAGGALGAALATQGLAVALFQRGHVVLHASSVALDGIAVAFAGWSGAGKSTLAAACLGRGARLLADDIVCVDAGTGHPRVRPAAPALRLDPTAPHVPAGSAIVEALGAHDGGKAILHVPRFEPAPLPLAAIFVLGEGEAVTLAQQRGQAASIELLRCSYVARLAERRAAARHFRACAALAAAVPVFTLRRPRDLSSLDDSARVVLETLDGLASTARP